MSNSLKTGLGAVLVIVIALLLGRSIGNDNSAVVAGASGGYAYQGTTTYNAAGAVNLNKDVILKSTPGVLRGYLITGAVAGSVIFYDANTKDASTTALGASSTIAIFPASTAAGFYPIDIPFTRGLLMSFSSATALPTSTPTWE